MTFSVVGTDMEEPNRMPLPVPDISRNLFDLSGYCSIITGVRSPLLPATLRPTTRAHIDRVDIVPHRVLDGEHVGESHKARIVDEHDVDATTQVQRRLD
jgi:hypothetical protein